MVEGQQARLAVMDADAWELEDGEARQRETPETFWMPPSEERHGLRRGDLVKLIFRIGLRNKTGDETEEVERMWVIVGGWESGLFWGTLDNDPYCTDDIKSGLRVYFEPRHVIEIDVSDRVADA